jgi:hypothetical protein
MSSKKPHGNRKYHQDFILEEAKKYHTKAEFLLHNEKAFRSGRAFGKDFFEKMCSHMVDFRFSTPQLICKKILEAILDKKCSYNDRKALGGLELDIFFEDCNLAVEYNGIVWHKKSHVKERDEKKRELCRSKGISLITIEQNSIYPKDYEQEIKDALIKNLQTIKDVCSKDISQEDIIAVECSDMFQEMAEASNRSIEVLKEKIKECSTIKEFQEKYPSECKFIRRNRQNHLFDDIRVKKINISDEDAVAASLKFSSLQDFRTKEPDMYQICSRRKLMHLVIDFLSTHRRPYKLQTDNQIIKAYDERAKQNKQIPQRMKEEIEKRGLLEQISSAS